MADLETLHNAINELETQSNDLKEFNKIYSEIGKLKNDISESLKYLKENNDGFSSISNDIQTRLESSKKQLEIFENDLQKRIQEIYQDNKSFQKELDSTLLTRLDKHKSDIQIEIRNEGTQIQRAFETTLNSNFISFESKFKESFNIQTKELNTLKTLLFVLIGISIVIAIKLFLK